MPKNKSVKRDPLRTEAAIKRGVRAWRSYDAHISGAFIYGTQAFEIAFVDSVEDKVIAFADVRDLYRKRAPIRMKDLRKAIQPRKRRK